MDIYVKLPNALGDNVVASDPIKKLKEANRDSRIFVVTSRLQLHEGSPYIDEFVKPEGFTPPVGAHFIDLSSYLTSFFAEDQDYFRTPLHLAGIMCKIAGVDPLSPQPKLYLTDKERKSARNNLRTALVQAKVDPEKPVLAIQTIGSNEFKNWRGEYWTALAHQLKKDCTVVQLIGGKKGAYEPPQEKRNIVVIDGLGFRESPAIIAAAQVGMFPDTFTLHVAYAAGQRNVLALIGARHPNEVSYSVFMNYTMEDITEKVTTTGMPNGYKYWKLPLMIMGPNDEDWVSVDNKVLENIVALNNGKVPDPLRLKEISPEDVVTGIRILLKRVT